MGKIFIEGMQFYSYHGVYDEETKLGRPFIIDLIIETDFSDASKYDNFKLTIDYADLFLIINNEMKIKSKLLENIGYRIIESIWAKYKNITYIRVKINKPHPPINGKIDNVGIIIEKYFN